MNGSKPTLRKLSPRRMAEGLATFMIIGGIVMMVQPLWMALFSYSFIVVITGTALFMAGSKLPE